MDSRKRKEKQRYDAMALDVSSASSQALEKFGPDAIDEILRPPYERFEAIARSVTPPEARVLDIGAGTGVHSIATAGENRHVVAADISLDALRAAKERFRLARRAIDLVCADSELLPFRDGTFDTVTSAGALYCFDHTVIAHVINKVLKRSGTWVIVDSFNHNPVYFANRFVGWLRGKRTWPAVSNIPSASTISVFERYFKTVALEYFGALTFLTPLLRRVLGMRKTITLLQRADRVAFLHPHAFKVVITASQPVR